ncbi:phage holin family protein [Candidatus Aalborgicola defluviihabitans]|uniref:phage holin family protein n=1 Tax=Candidatus Aalborgicola defluviihabitans TaxID=3386187 RepID=UPI001DEE29CE|nr:phage holin family protein [Burkholderiales bacterium]
MKLITKWLLSAASLLLVAYLYSGVEIKSYSAALIAALDRAVQHGFAAYSGHPDLPVTVVTLGLFLLVINALMFWSAGPAPGRLHRGGTARR